MRGDPFTFQYSQIHNVSPTVNSEYVLLPGNNEDFKRIYVIEFFINQLHTYGDAHMDFALSDGSGSTRDITFRIQTWSTGGGQTQWMGTACFLCTGRSIAKCTGRGGNANVIIRKIGYFNKDQITQNYVIKY